MNEKRHKPSPGPTPLYGEPMKQTAIFLPIPMYNWLKAQPAPMSETIRNVIDEAMARDGKNLG